MKLSALSASRTKNVDFFRLRNKAASQSVFASLSTTAPLGCRGYAKDESCISLGTNDNGPQTMEESYKNYSFHQYSAHEGCADMLASCMERLGRRIEQEDRFLMASPRRRLLADLGSADGSNSMKTLQWAMANMDSPVQSSTPFHIVFEEHPRSDQALLETTLKSHQSWFQSRDITYSILMKSFYEPLFEANSVDFVMSYISLHWLNPPYGENSILEWKRLHLSEQGNNFDYEEKKSPTLDAKISNLSNFVSVHEITAPKSLHETWRLNLARDHLALFLELRARELRPGGEMLLMMVADPHQFLRPPNGEASPLTLALKRCVQNGSVRQEILERVIIPYFLRQPKDIKAALDFLMASKGSGAPLELIDIRSYETITASAEESSREQRQNAGACRLFWSIHAGALKAAGATLDEQDKIQECLFDIFEDLYDSSVGIKGTFLACVLRRRTRSPWTK